jgi:chromosome segregation ATPase
MDVSSTNLYYVQGKGVTEREYELEVERLGFRSQFASFIISQNQADSLVNKSPMELTNYIERVSNSIRHKPQYDELQSQKSDY